jgi:hypothetical protein
MEFEFLIEKINFHFFFFFETVCFSFKIKLLSS